MNNYANMNIVELASLIEKKEVSPYEITKQILNKINETNKINNIFITVRNGLALEEAKIAEQDILNGNYKGFLHGIPISIKDNISVKSTRMTNGSMIFNDHISPIDALIVKQLRSQGAIIIGKTNMDEFANHVMGKNEAYGTILNPNDDNHSVGGSSGGSAASVAANLAYASIGTDTSGSVRIPASCCGIVGLKPTYNLIPVMDVSPLSWTLDHVGILSKNCQDLSLLFNAIVPGSNSKDSNLDKSVKVEEITIGIPDNYFFESLDSEVEAKVKEVINLMLSYGAKEKHIEINNVDNLMDVQETIIRAESAYYHHHLLDNHEDDYEKDNYNFFKDGLTVSNSQYKESLKIKEKTLKSFQKLFTDIDIIVTPTLPITAPKLSTETVQWGDVEEDVLITLSRYTGVFNVAGLPALSIPIGNNSNNLPIGLQIIGDMYSENQLLSIGHWIMDKITKI